MEFSHTHKPNASRINPTIMQHTYLHAQQVLGLDIPYPRWHRALCPKKSLLYCEAQNTKHHRLFDASLCYMQNFSSSYSSRLTWRSRRKFSYFAGICNRTISTSTPKFPTQLLFQCLWYGGTLRRGWASMCRKLCTSVQYARDFRVRKHCYLPLFPKQLVLSFALFVGLRVVLTTGGALNIIKSTPSRLIHSLIK